MRDITGAPGVYKDAKNPDEIFDYLIECEKKKYLMTAGTKSDDNRNSWVLSDSGIIASHAYSILDVQQISDNDKLI